jgi:hypothetical protein
MPCSKPIDAWFSYDRNASGKRSVQFSPDGAFGDGFAIPCGQCASCRIDRAAQWGSRIDMEVATMRSRGFEGAIFLTLTYSDEHLPSGGSLRKKHLQDFNKRVREHVARKFGGKRLRHFGAGEYGERLARPHYHEILIGHDFREDRKRWRTSGLSALYRSESLEKLWPFGQVEFGDCGAGAGAYVAQYSLKKVYGDAADAWYQGREPEFLICSQGLGRHALELDLGPILAHGLRGRDGRVKRLPRGFERYLPAEKLAQLKAQRVERARKHWRDNTPERLAARVQVTLARMRRYRNRV